MSDFAHKKDDELRRDESAVRRSDDELRRDESAASKKQPAPRREDRQPRDRAAAQQRANRIRAFRAELTALRAAGIDPLTDEGRAEIFDYHDRLLRRLAAEHDIDRSESAGQLSRGMQIAAFIAATALTAAVYSLVERFWGRLHLPVQATLLCAFPLIALIGVELSAQRERTLYVASICGLVAFGTYWLAIFVLGDLLNVPVTPPAVWGGALFGAALALPYGFRVIFGGALVALLVALSGSVMQAGGIPWTAAAEFPEIITVEALLLFAAASHLMANRAWFAAVTRGVPLTIGLLGLFILSVAGQATLLPLSPRGAEGLYQGLMLVICSVVLAVSLRRQWLESVYIAAAGLTLFTFSRFFDWFWETLPRFVFFLLLAAMAFGWLLALRRVRSRLKAEDAA